MSHRRGSRNFRTACEWSLTTISVKTCDFGGVAIPFPCMRIPWSPTANGVMPPCGPRTSGQSSTRILDGGSPCQERHFCLSHPKGLFTIRLSCGPLRGCRLRCVDVGDDDGDVVVPAPLVGQ